MYKTRLHQLLCWGQYPKSHSYHIAENKWSATGHILDINPSKVGDEDELGAFDKIQTSISIIFQSEIVPFN